MQYGYVDDLVIRFRNPAMHHLLRQIGWDGSLRIPERWFPALRALRAVSAPTPMLELSLAAWVNATQRDETGAQVYSTTDPAADALARCWAAPDPRALVASLLRRVGAADVTKEHDLILSVAQRPPALHAGRVDL
jgi:fructuronate reductase